MIVLNLTSGGESIIVTLTEKCVLVAPYYLFVFTHVTTKKVVKKIYATADDFSIYQTRNNEFVINTALVFANQKSGQWQYKVYEQASSTNTDETGLNLLENGKLLINEGAKFGYSGYAPSTQYTGYAG